MALFDAYGREIRQLPAVYAKFDAAQTTDENARHWSMATDYDADREASPDVRAILRRRSRYEAGNNPWVKGMITTQAYDIVGTGPRLQVLTEDSNLNNTLEADFIEWAKAVRLAAKMHTMRMAQSRDGEAFAVLFSNPMLRTRVKLDMQLIEADCVRGDYRDTPSGTYVDGITYDKHDNPVSYNVLPHPGSGDISTRGVRVPAERMIHLFSADRPGQHRGIPELTSALPSFAMLRRYTLAMVKKMETSANISGVIQTEEIDSDEAESVEAFKIFSLPRDAFAALPKNYRLQSHMLNNPTDSQSNFALQVKTELARALNLPKNVALGDSSSYNYASGRMDFQAYDKYLGVERMNIELVVLSAIMSHFLSEFWPLSKLRRIEPLPHTWFWDGRAHVDPVKEARAQTQLLANGTTTLARECARQGLDWEEVQDQRLLEEWRERDRRKELGLPPREVEQVSEYDPEDEELNRDEESK